MHGDLVQRRHNLIRRILLILAGCAGVASILLPVASVPVGAATQLPMSPHKEASYAQSELPFDAITTSLAHAASAKFIRSALPSSSAPPRDLTSVYFLTHTHGFGVTGSFTNGRAQLLETKDGGKTWLRRATYPGGFTHLSWSGQTGVATGEYIDSKGQPALELSITHDGGNTWTLVKPSLNGIHIMTTGLPEVYAHVTSNSTVWILISPEAATTSARFPVLVSHDGGHSFHQVTLPTGYVSTGGFSFHGYAALSVFNRTTNRYGVLVGDDKGGFAKLGPNTATPLYAVDYVSSTQIYAGGGNFAKYGQQPAEEIWSLHPDNPLEITVVMKRNGHQGVPYQPIVGLDFANPTASYMLTGGVTMGGNLPAPGPLFVSRDNGFHFSATGVSGTALYTIGSEAYVSGNGLGLQVSSDAGKTWRLLVQPQTLTVENVQFASAKVGFVVTNLGIYRTLDGGQSWTQVHWPTQVASANNYDFVSARQIYSYSATSLFASMDGGQVWRRVHLPGIEQIDGLSALPDGHVFLSALPLPGHTNHPFEDSLYESADGGRHWSNIGSPFHTSPVALDFTSQTAGYARAPMLDLKTETRPPALFSTVKGGRHWQQRTIQGVQDTGSNTVSGAGQVMAIAGERALSNGTQQGIILFTNPTLKRFLAVKTGPFLADGLSLASPTDLWMAADGQLFHSTDGGQNFREVHVVH